MPSTSLKPLPLQVRADLFNGLATLEKSGLPQTQALAVLRLPRKAQVRVEKMMKLTARGVDIPSAGARSGLFTPFEVSVVRAAVQAGSPAATYRRLAERYQQQAQQRASIKSRLSLPLFVLIIALCVQPLPSLVAGTLSGGAYLVQVLRPLVLLAGLVYFMFWLKTWLEQAPATPLVLELARFMTRLPLFGEMHVRQVNREFFTSMALLLEAGIPMLDALPRAVDSMPNPALRADFARLKQRMTRGASLSQALQGAQNLGNDQVLGYIQTGEASGTLPEMLQRFVDMETAAITRFQQELSTWLPRIVYALLALWMAHGILTSGAFMPNLPAELR